MAIGPNASPYAIGRFEELDRRPRFMERHGGRQTCHPRAHDDHRPVGRRPRDLGKF
jgi:hypothetical protein